MPPPFTFARKAVCAVALVALADALFYDEGGTGATLGAFMLAWVAGLFAAVPALRRRASAWVLALAATLGLVMVDDPSLLAVLLFLMAIASAALLPRHRFDDALRWAARIVAFGLFGIVRPLVDLHRLARRRMPGRISKLAAALVLPVAGTLVFGALFAIANPLIGNAVSRLEWPELGDLVVHLAFWAAVFVFLWPSLRPRSIRMDGLPGVDARPLDLPVATLTLSLVAFNGLFALQNALDIAFLWSGAPLPDGVTLAEYAHRGAYTLIATALLAGAFVLVALAPGSRAAGNRLVRRLVALWVGQNVLLVSSSMLRLFDYVEAYSLTELRIAALLWMALVAVGLLLILLRLMTGRSAAWLLNANAAAAAVVLLGSTAVDYGALAAAWNVRHARDGARLDLCYLQWQGASALLPLIELERRAGGPELRDRVRYLRLRTTDELALKQADWRSWTWRGARRLNEARRLTADMPSDLRPAPWGRGCDGRRTPKPEPQVAPAPRLTEGARP